MSTRQLLSASQRSTDTTATPASQRSPNSNVRMHTQFKLQAAPRTRRQKRIGRIFSKADGHDEQTRSDKPIFMNPFSAATAPPKGFTCFRERFPGHDMPGSPEEHSRHSGQMTLSPKQILHADIRIIYPLKSEFEDDDTDENGDAMTLRAMRFPLPPSMERDEEECIKTAVTTPTSSNMTNGTFGVLRRRSNSVQTSGGATPSSEHGSTVSSAESPIATRASALEHTIVCLSPMSPLSPGRRAALHTPNCVSTTFADRLALPSAASLEVEPLSATLRRLGAARTSYRFATVAEEDEGEEEGVPPPMPIVVAPNGWNERMSKRMDENKRAHAMLHDNRQASVHALPLLLVQRHSESDDSLDSNDEKGNQYATALPSPSPSRFTIQSTVRGGPRASLWRTLRRTSNTLASYIFSNPQRPRATPVEVFFPTFHAADQQTLPLPATPREAAALSKERCSRRAAADGWGGMRPRSSWFPNFRIGPLLSPTKRAESRFANLRMPSTEQVTQDSSKDDAMWVDDDGRDDEAHRESLNDEAQPSVLSRLRVRFPSQLPQPTKARQEEQRRLHAAHCAGFDATSVTYTSTSAEGRPCKAGGASLWIVAAWWHQRPLRRICAVVGLLIVAAAVAGLLVLLLDRQHNPTMAERQSPQRRGFVLEAVQDSNR